MMLTFEYLGIGMYEDSANNENSDFSFLRSSDESLYGSNTDIYNNREHTSSPVYDMPPKLTKPDAHTQRLAEMVPPGMQRWRNKFIDHWTSEDCLMWLLSQLQSLGVTSLADVKMENMVGTCGLSLKEMPLDSFTQMFPEHGYELYHRLQKAKASFMENYYSLDHWNNNNNNNNNNAPQRLHEPYSCFHTPPPQESPTLTDLDSETRPLPQAFTKPLTTVNTTGNFYNPYSTPPAQTTKFDIKHDYNSDDSSGEASVTEEPPVVVKRRPGRPRSTRKKKKPEKLGRLWEFIRDLLLDPKYNPSMICWENYDEGMFRFVHSDRVAKLWGSKKENTEMNYEKLSRAMRYYYKSQVLLPVYGKRLVYKFGPTATGWRSEHPIMRCQKG